MRETLLTFLDDCRKHGEQTAVAHESGVRLSRWSYARIASSAFQFARELETRGIGPGDRVLFWGRRTYEIFEELSNLPASGVLMREGVEIWHEPALDPWWADAVPRVRRCHKDELPPGYQDGHAFVAPIVEMPIYLSYLMDRLAASGDFR